MTFYTVLPAKNLQFSERQHHHHHRSASVRKCGMPGAVSMEDPPGRETRRWLMTSKDSSCNSRIIAADHRNRSLKRRTSSMTMGPSYTSEKSLPRSAVNTRTTQESSMASHPTGRSGVMDDHQIRSHLCFSCLLHSRKSLQST